MLLVMVDICDELTHSRPNVKLGLIVDDLSIQCIGQADEVATQVLQATDTPVLKLEGLGLIVSKGDSWQPGGKSVVVATSAALRKRLSMSFKKRGIKTVRTARHLGVDYDPETGRVKKKATAKARQKEAKAKRQRIQALVKHKKIAGRLTRVMIVASRSYGTAVTGMSDKDIADLNKEVHVAMGKATGRSSFPRLMLTGGLPATRPATAPVMALARAIFDKDLSPKELTEGWRHASTQWASQPGTNCNASGPADAALRALRRVGWAWPAPYPLVTQSGIELDMRLEAPLTIQKLLEMDFTD